MSNRRRTLTPVAATVAALMMVGMGVVAPSILSAQSYPFTTVEIQRLRAFLNGTTTTVSGPELAPTIGAGTGYTCGAGWDCSVVGTLNKNADGVGTAVPNPALTVEAGKTYKIVIVVGAVTVGNGATYTLGGVGGSAPLTAATTYVHTVTTVTTGNLIITPTPTTTRFTITHVSVAQVTTYPDESSGWKAQQIETLLSVQTTGTSAEVLRTFTIPANTFPDQYKGFKIVATATTAANTNNKFLRFQITNIAGTIITQGITNTSGSSLLVQAECWLETSTSLLCMGLSGAHNTANSGVPLRIPSWTFTNPNYIVVAGTTDTASTDMTLTSIQSYFFRP